jgi:hypothetical protein
VFDFAAAIDGHYIDAVGDVIARDGSVWIVGSCPGFVTTCDDLVARFDDSGALTDVLELVAPPDSPWQWLAPAATLADDGVLWVQAFGRLLRIVEDVDGGLAVLDSTPLDPRVRAPLLDLVRTASGQLFGLDAGNRLVALSDEAALEGAWQLYSYQRLLGGTRSPVQLTTLADGNVAVLDGDSGRLVVFDDKVAAP